MAREYAKIWLDRYNNPEWCALSQRAQWLYDVLISTPKISYAGAVEWKPKQVAKLAGALSVDEVEAALTELRLNLFVVLDEDVDVILIRSYVRNDGMIKNTNLMLAVAKDFSSIGSIDLKAVFMHEMGRLRTDFPDAGIWSEKKMLVHFESTPAISARDYVTNTWSEYAAFWGLDTGAEQASDPVFRMDHVDA